MRITSYDAVRAVLEAPGFEVPPVPAADGPELGVAWLRAHVSRFSNGTVHQRRRRLATTMLAGIEPAGLEGRAADHAARLLAGAGEGPFDLMATVARVVPVEVLAASLGLPGGLAGPVTTVAGAYLPPAEPAPAADRAVRELVAACGGVADEATAARIALLVQAAAATAGLIGNALAAWLRDGSSSPPEVVIGQTLRWDPPVRLTRRLATAPATVGDQRIPAGTVVELDLAAAGRAAADGEYPTFGYGPRACPGRAHALAIAAGVLRALRGYRLLAVDLPHRLVVAG